MRLLVSLLLLCGMLVGEAEGFFSHKPKHVTIDLLHSKCISLFWSSCRSCSGKCVRGKTARCKKAPCESNPCGKDEKCVNNYCGGCHACCVKKPFCSGGHRSCANGKVYRDPDRRCELPKCQCPPKGWTRTGNIVRCLFFKPKCGAGYKPWSHISCGCGCKPVVCPKDTKTCPDGSTVVRDPKNHCHFAKCPCPPKGWLRFGDPHKCKTYKPKCKYGYVPWYHKECGCGCKPLPKCEKDYKYCPDGSKVVRDIHKKCEFPKCKCKPDGWTHYGYPDKCKNYKPKCKYGYEPWFHKECGCGCKPLPKCDDDYKYCPDGSKVVRDIDKKCEFPKCKCKPDGWTHYGGPDKCKGYKPKCEYGFEPWYHKECGCGCKPVRKCGSDEKKCLDGTKVGRNPDRNCEFPKCNCEPDGWTQKEASREKCKRLRFSCKRNFRKWYDDECGCGCRPRPCRKGTRTCPDGSKVERDPKNKCRFAKCECPPKGWYLSAGPRKCRKYAPKCKQGYEPWSHKLCGCGCKPAGNGSGGY